MRTKWWQKVKKQVIQEVPPVLALCEFDCRQIDCWDCPFLKSGCLKEK